MKLEASSKPKCNHHVVTKTIPLVQQKRKKENNPLSESTNDDVGQAAEHGLACKKGLTRHGG